MKTDTTKKRERLEKKKKKVAALLEIAKLNDKDRIEVQKQYDIKNDSIKEGEIREEYIGSKMKGKVHNSEKYEEIEDGGLHRKRLKTNDGGTSVVVSPEKEDKMNIFEKQTARDFNMSTEEYLKLKKELRERKNILKVIPRISLNETGNKASIESACRVPLFMSDIQHLMLYSQLGHHSPVKPRWCNVEKYNRIAHTVVLIIEGVSVYDLVSNESSCPNFADLKFKVEFVSPFNYDGILAEEFAAVPLSKSQMHNLEKRFGSLRKAVRTSGLVFRVLRSIFPVKHSELGNAEDDRLPKTDKFPRTDLLLSAWQMVEEGFPLPLKGEMKDRYVDYVMTKEEYSEVTPMSPLWGLDCEMCLTCINESELTRISIVDENCKTVYDTLVQPPNKITNYLTKFSGITKTMLEGVTKTLQDVQEDLRRLLPPDVILVGQSLNFDLHALKMMHPYVIDTSIIFNLSGMRPRKPKLAVLCSIFLNKTIQDGYGHDSVEDSSAALKLVKLKLENSVEFGDAVLGCPLSHHIHQNYINSRNQSHPPFSVLEQNNNQANEKTKKSKNQNQSNNHEEILFTSLFSHVTKRETRAAVIAQKDILMNYETFVSAPAFDSDNSESLVSSMEVDSNRAAIKKTCVESNFHSFIVTHLKLSEIESIKDIDNWCGEIFQSLEFHSLFAVIFAGSVDTPAHGTCMLSIKQRPNQFRFKNT